MKHNTTNQNNSLLFFEGSAFMFLIEPFDFVDNMKKDFMQRTFFMKEAFLAVCGFGYITCWTLEPTSKQKHSSIRLTKQGSIFRKFIVKELGVY